MLSKNVNRSRFSLNDTSVAVVFNLIYIYIYVSDYETTNAEEHNRSYEGFKLKRNLK